MHCITLTYTKPLLRQAVRSFWWRVVGFKYFVALALVAASLLGLILDGDTSWFVGVLASVLVFGITFVVALYVIHYGNSLRKLQAMGSHQAKLEASEASLSLSSGASVATLPWSAVTEVWRFKSCWLLLFSKSQFVTLPLADIPTEARAFIIARVQTSGGKVE
ncbi:YcxB family protein [Dyella acidisoli]|uniref:YcxB-like C-terminal domain-containing protein n=1 Tax=Dyella acidisoli TaxID=1867834 RepID=A0ABQ5XQN0_9GAMM|nr:YcxB family protein [Dyella acidisoli]GLQ94061.1 hypothetical protein GCM10007901_30120 [Dyella acidisoli]